MRRNTKSWLIIISFISVISLILLAPTFVGDSMPSWWSKVFPERGIRLGLDLRGGIFLMLDVQKEEAVGHELTNIKNLVSDDLLKDKILIKDTRVGDKSVTFDFFTKNDLQKAKKKAEDYSDIADIKEDNLSLSVVLKNSTIENLQRDAIKQVMSVIINRISEFGLIEPTIQQAGEDRILIQVPQASDKDRERIISIIRKTAVLEFKLVEDVSALQEPLLSKYEVSTPEELIEKGYMLHVGETGTENEKFFVTEADARVSGKYLSDARLIFDQFGRAAVGFTFRGEGADTFYETTKANVNRRLAIVLDGRIKSAPNIEGAIRSSGQITGNFTPEEARDLALVLRSGSLPVSVNIEQERTVGPSLGRDSIEKGKFSMLLGGLLVFIFMVIAYKKQGFIADIALGLNVLFIMGALSAFGVTLTLPGIAGLVLTLGMAVDGNIIIFERIKEELRGGKVPLNAIDSGYGRSLWTILDANITTLITALILFWFGTGPIKGFAATLSIGIVTTVFSNVIVARVFTNLIHSDKKMKTLSI
ncbi:MAG: protein translocase subunit SecD [Phycisphaerae bacterium]|nr:protein translocase subunit SecD [Phycisphaerae bacterium]NIU11131.1 protein translocase subunit SecD [Phycisphaerae bacterium]NIX01238.1 protein translocase subunit SecD [Phycisphaerae bacterium]